MTLHRIIRLWLVLFSLGPVAIARAQDRVSTLPIGDVRQRVLLSPAAAPRGTIVMLPGGTGDIGLERDGTIRHDHNFVVRTRALWNQHGYSVLIPDTIDRESLRGERSTTAYATIVAALVAFAHDQTPGPVFVLGTSQGTIAALRAASTPDAPATLAGVVLTESVSVMGNSGETVFDAQPGQVRIPALIVANRMDRCRVAPPDAAPRIAAALTASPDRRVLVVSGGTTRSGDSCGSLTPHGYFGMEDAVVAAIVTWMDAHAR